MLMTKRRFQVSLRTFLGASVALAVGLGGALVLVASSFQESAARVEQTLAMLQRAAPLLAERLDRTLRDVGLDVSLAALSEQLGEGASSASLERFLAMWQKLRPDYADILVADRTGRVRATASGKFLDADVSGSLWFGRGLQGMAAADATESSKAGTQAPRNVIVSAPIAEGAKGVIAVQMTPRWVEEATQAARRSLGEPGRTIAFSVINASGRAIIQSDPQAPTQRDARTLEASASLGGAEGPGLGWLILARGTPNAVAGTHSDMHLMPLLLFAILTAGGAAWLGGGILGRRLRRIEAWCAREETGQPITSLPIRELQGLAESALASIARGRSRERIVQDTRSALVRSRERVRAFKTMAGWSCWEVDLTNGRVTWTDAVLPIMSCATERATSLDDLVNRLDPDDRDLMRVAMRAAIAAGGAPQDVTLQTLPVNDERAGRRLLLRMARVVDDDDTRERLHVLSREVGVVNAVKGDVSPVVGPLAAEYVDPSLERRKDGLLRTVTDGIVHDINNAIAVIMTALGVLKNYGDDLPEQSQRMVDVALRGARNGAALTRQVTALTQREVSTLGETDIASVIDDLTEFLKSSVAPQITIGMSLDDNLPPVLCSERHFEILILNLILDVKTAVPGGCGVSLMVEAAQPAATSLLATRPSLRLTFSAPADLSKGRGLTSVANLADEIGAAFEVQAVGGNTNVILWLPAGERQPVVQTPGSVSADELKILLVEPDMLLRSTAANALAELGHDVTVAAASEQAMEILSARRDFDVLIADYAMPGMSGLHLAATISRTHPRLRIILAGPRGHLPANAQVFQQLHKPFGFAELTLALETQSDKSARAA